LADERGLDLDVDKLYVKTAIANEGPRLKRIRPAPMGRAFRYQRRMAHISISVAELVEAPEKVAKTPRKAVTGPAKAKKSA
jgi:large subunit ribosomal protein L22